MRQLSVVFPFLFGSMASEPQLIPTRRRQIWRVLTISFFFFFFLHLWKYFYCKKCKWCQIVRIFIVERILKPLNNHWLLGSSYRGCFGMESEHTSSLEPPPKKKKKNWLFFFLKPETQITEGQYLWQATEFNVLSKWDLGLNGPSYALKAMRSAHHFGPNKGYHHVVAFLTIAHRNPLIKWALCRTSYKRACYTIVGSNNNTRRGQLSKRSQSHRGGVKGWGG